MMIRRIALLVAAFALPSLAALDPALLALVPAGATTLAGADLRQAKGSVFGQFVLSKMQAEEAEFQKLLDATGFDPRRDVDQVLVAAFTPASGTSRAQGLVLARGRYDAARIAATAQASGSAVTSEGGVTLISPGRSKSGLIAFPESTLAVVGDADAVRAALARRPMSGPTEATLANLAAKWSDLDAWFVTTAASQLSGRMGAGNQKLQSSALQSVEVVAGGVQLDGATVTARLEAQTKTAQDATALADVARFLAGMVQLNRNNDPQAAEIARILDKAVIASSGQVVTIEVSIPEADLERLINEASKSHGRKPASRRKEAAL